MKRRNVLLFSVCCWFYVTNNQVEPCTVDQFECSNGNCIDVSGRCDDNFDCADLSDEENCGGGIFCPEGLYRCDDGTCVHTEAECNSITHCSDGTSCVVTPTTSSSQTLDTLTVKLTMDNTSSPIQTNDMISSFVHFSSTKIELETMSTLPTITEFQRDSTQSTELSIETYTHIDLSSAVSSMYVTADFSSSSFLTSSQWYSTFLESTTSRSLLPSVNLFTANETPILSTISINSYIYSILYSSIETASYQSNYSSLLVQSVLPGSKADHISVLYSSDLTLEAIQLSTLFKETQQISSSNLKTSFVTTEPLETLFVSSALESSSVLSSDLSTVITTSPTTETSNATIDKDILIPLIIVGCLVFLVVCAAAWKFREHIRKRNRKGKFGSIISLDMVHPHPDMKGALGKPIVKTSSYNALNDI